MKQPCMYILASKRNGTLYVGVTSDLVQRVWQHRTDEIDVSPSSIASTCGCILNSTQPWRTPSNVRSG